MTATKPAVFSTPDLCDQYSGEVRVLEPVFQSYGGASGFCGEIVTVRCFEDNSRVKELAGRDGRGRIMAVDGGGSLRKALLGDLIAGAAVENGWAGFLIYGAIRDVEAISVLPLGVLALNAIPLKTERRNQGEVDIPVSFAGQTLQPGEYLYADRSGVLVSSRNLLVK